jgi:hypothetical protein
MFVFLYNFCLNISRSKTKWARYDQKRYWPSCKIPVIFVRVLWYLNYREMFEKCLTIRFRETPSCGGRVVPCRQMNMILIVAFRNFANAPKRVAVLTELFCVIWIYKTRREVVCLAPTKRGERGAVTNYPGPGSAEGGPEHDYVAYVFVFLGITITSQ